MSVRVRSLRTRLLWGTLLIIAVVMTAVMLVVEHRQRTAIVDEVQRRGEAIAAASGLGVLIKPKWPVL